MHCILGEHSIVSIACKVYRFGGYRFWFSNVESYFGCLSQGYYIKNVNHIHRLFQLFSFDIFIRGMTLYIQKYFSDKNHIVSSLSFLMCDNHTFEFSLTQSYILVVVAVSRKIRKIKYVKHDYNDDDEHMKML